VRVAAAQAHPIWGDKGATTKKVIDWIGAAADADVQLVAFGETFLSGYPFWLSITDGARFNDPRQKAAYAFYLDAAVELQGPELAEIAEAARDHKVATYLGIAERGNGPARGTVFCTLVAIDPAAGLVVTHRKLMPTYEERLVWGIGDGAGLEARTLANRWRVGGLLCWENWMPQARHALYADGEDLHVALWPGGTENTRDITRFIALEGRTFVLSAGALLGPQDIPTAFPLSDDLPSFEYDGGSAIAAPDGSWLAEPVSGEERLVMADLDLSMVARERQNFDPTGHYARPDVFQVTVDRRPRSAAAFLD